LLLGPLLAACAATGAASVAPPDATHSAAVRAEDCGTIEQNLGGTTPENAHALAQCLLSAYQACRPATLRFDWTGDDSRTDYVLAVAPSDGGCRVMDTSVFILDTTSAGGPQPAKTFTCRTVAPHGGEIVVQGCGADGDITLP
jgi:hypothetical protein